MRVVSMMDVDIQLLHIQPLWGCTNSCYAAVGETHGYSYSTLSGWAQLHSTQGANAYRAKGSAVEASAIK